MTEKGKWLSRREFIFGSLATALAAILAGCTDSPAATKAPTSPNTEADKMKEQLDASKPIVTVFAATKYYPPENTNSKNLIDIMNQISRNPEGKSGGVSNFTSMWLDLMFGHTGRHLGEAKSIPTVNSTEKEKLDLVAAEFVENGFDFNNLSKKGTNFRLRAALNLNPGPNNPRFAVLMSTNEKPTELFVIKFQGVVEAENEAKVLAGLAKASANPEIKNFAVVPSICYNFPEYKGNPGFAMTISRAITQVDPEGKVILAQGVDQAFAAGLLAPESRAQIQTDVITAWLKVAAEKQEGEMVAIINPFTNLLVADGTNGKTGVLVSALTAAQESKFSIEKIGTQWVYKSKNPEWFAQLVQQLLYTGPDGVVTPNLNYMDDLVAQKALEVFARSHSVTFADGTKAVKVTSAIESAVLADGKVVVPLSKLKTQGVNNVYITEQALMNMESRPLPPRINLLLDAIGRAFPPLVRAAEFGFNIALIGAILKADKIAANRLVEVNLSAVMKSSADRQEIDVELTPNEVFKYVRSVKRKILDGYFTGTLEIVLTPEEEIAFFNSISIPNVKNDKNSILAYLHSIKNQTDQQDAITSFAYLARYTFPVVVSTIKIPDGNSPNPQLTPIETTPFQVVTTYTDEGNNVYVPVIVLYCKDSKGKWTSKFIWTGKFDENHQEVFKDMPKDLNPKLALTLMGKTYRTIDVSKDGKVVLNFK